MVDIKKAKTDDEIKAEILARANAGVKEEVKEEVKAGFKSFHVRNVMKNRFECGLLKIDAGKTAEIKSFDDGTSRFMERMEHAVRIGVLQEV